MKVFILKSKTATYVVADVVATEDFYLVPIHNSNGFDVYSREVFSLSVEETRVPSIGFVTSGKQEEEEK